MSENWVDIPLEKVSDDVLRQHFFTDEIAIEQCRKMFMNFANDWLLAKDFYSRKVGEMKYEFYYDIQICIDDIRELIENSKYSPTSAQYKIFIIDEVHML